MIFTDSIVAIATPAGIGGICIVRLSGTKSLQIAKHITHKHSFTPRYATLCSLYDTDDTLFDEAIVIYYQAPKSYTCEDVIEFQCHGGDLIGRKLIALCLQYGARIAHSGEFTKRAFLNGRIDFAQVNAIAKLITTKDSYFQKALASQLKGELEIFVNEVREILVSSLAYCEVMIDYSEEDISDDVIQKIDSKLSRLFERLHKIYEFSLMREGYNAGWKLCIIGKPNVGKSSILNALLLFDRAITSPIAGTTRDTIEEDIFVDGCAIRLIDTAGIRQSDDIIEEEGIKKSKLALKQSNIALGVFDISQELDSRDLEVLSLLSKESNQTIFILNKNDKPQRLDTASLAPFTNNATILRINALDKESSALQIKQALSDILAKNTLDSGIILSASYQIQAIAQTLDSLKKAREKLASLELELFSYHIKDALESIGLITHPYATDEMLDAMFSEFCLGK